MGIRATPGEVNALFSTMPASPSPQGERPAQDSVGMLLAHVTSHPNA